MAGCNASYHYGSVGNNSQKTTEVEYKGLGNREIKRKCLKLIDSKNHKKAKAAISMLYHIGVYTESEGIQMMIDRGIE